ncbi:PTS sugar transporter subunit IIA [Pedosphaera parvula]|uniref:Putative PTS IIA-like nitrogen-regulatory protein PtsN n=1 Tax=Pedosphaera parvula (strain Ellin514) TaxID=320771 RepID=B9XEC4_PEDPL|nr:PTS sugar transporter subunit IIA [Pedosphaera parvula]EEF61638.1 putative PTS IIA-like nitrogen-regulatory protein PtsN [Pedosphaera parvula Ellin514]
MNLRDFFGPDKFLPDLQAANRWEVIDELISHLVVTNQIKPEHREVLTAAVKEREIAMSTGIGFGIGLPHALSDLVDDVVAVCGQSKQGIDYNAPDNQPVKCVVLFLSPRRQQEQHTRFLADLAKALHKRDS